MGIDNILDATLNTAVAGFPGAYASQNAAEAQNHGILAGIGTQQNTLGNVNALYDRSLGNATSAYNGSMGNIKSLYSTQLDTGNKAFSGLQGALGLGGNAISPDILTQMPGYQFAVNQGTNAINRAAAANGNLFTPNTLANVGNYVAGNVAMPAYQNYVSSLLQTAGLDAQGNQAVTNANLQTGAGIAGANMQTASGLGAANLQTGGNISQLQQNSGNAQASGINSQWGSNGLGGILNGLNASGVFGQNGLGGLLGKGVGALGGAIGNIFGHNGSNGSGDPSSDIYGFGETSGYSSNPNDENYIGNIGNIGGSNIVDQYNNGMDWGGLNSQYGNPTLDNNVGNIDWSELGGNF